VTSGHTGASACAPDVGTARTAGGRRGRARTRLGVPGAVGISLNGFQNNFSPNFQTKVHLRSEAKLKISHSSTTFTKVGRGFVQESEQERYANLANFSAPVNSKPEPCFAIFTLLHSKPAMPLNRKVVCLNILHIFPFGWF
jgi:hypothetical protein